VNLLRILLLPLKFAWWVLPYLLMGIGAIAIVLLAVGLLFRG
jgi:hypothetical protein